MRFSEILTAAKLFPPGLDDYSFLTTLLTVRGKCLTQHLFVSLIQTHIVHTVVHEDLGVQFSMTFLEHIIGLGYEAPTESLSLVDLFLVIVTGRTVFLTCVPARMALVLVRRLPALAPLHYRGDRFSGWILEFITVDTVEVATQTTDTAVVAAGQLDDQLPVPVIGDNQAKVCFHHCSVTTLKHRHLPFTLIQSHRKIQQLPVHLKGMDQSNINNVNTTTDPSHQTRNLTVT